MGCLWLTTWDFLSVSGFSCYGSHWIFCGNRALSPDLSSVINFSCCSGLSHGALPDVFRVCRLPVGRGGTKGRATPGFDVDLSRFLSKHYLCNSCVHFCWVQWLGALEGISATPTRIGYPRKPQSHTQKGIVLPLPVTDQLKWYTCLALANHLQCPLDIDAHWAHLCCGGAPCSYCWNHKWKLGHLCLLS